MNKLTKAAIATAAGIALLMGGAGTLAYWNDSATLTGGTIAAGTLKIAVPTTVPSTDGWKANGTAVASLSAVKVVPGTVLTYTKTFDVTATGDNLSASIVLDPLAITASSLSAPADVALAGYLTKTATFTVDGATTSTINAAVGTQTVVVTTTITFPFGTVAGAENGAKSGSVSLANFAIKLTQTV